MEKTKVAVVGMGTVGEGVAKLLLDHGDRTARHAGRTLWLEKVIVRDLKKTRGVELPTGVISNDLSEVTSNPEINVVAQLIGGLEPARTIMLELLESGKDVVTANKALLAEHGGELFDRARELGRSIAFEASVAGGIPIITGISQCLSANGITSLRGILNGTSNYIVTRMDESGAAFDDCVAEAQQLGYAEADPSMDVDGSDAAQKLAILSHLAFGARIHWADIPRQGIDDLDTTDLRYANEMGYRIKLLAIAHLIEGGLQVRVAPMLIRQGKPLAEVREAFNAVSVVGDAVGRVFFHGQGAGQMPTASAVVADMIDTAVGRTQLTFETLELFSQAEARVDICPPDAARSRFYFRFAVDDHPGVLGQIASILGQNSISIASVIQHERETEAPVVPLVIMTDVASESATEKAIAEIDRLPSVVKAGVRLRVID
jgi:homoserine dehydrogenase